MHRLLAWVPFPFFPLENGGRVWGEFLHFEEMRQNLRRKITPKPQISVDEKTKTFSCFVKMPICDSVDQPLGAQYFRQKKAQQVLVLTGNIISLSEVFICLPSPQYLSTSQSLMCLSSQHPIVPREQMGNRNTEKLRPRLSKDFSES